MCIAQHFIGRDINLLLMKTRAMMNDDIDESRVVCAGGPAKYRC